MIYLFQDYDQVTDEILSQLMEKLPPNRRERALRFRYSNGQINCTIAYYLFLYGYRNEYGYEDLPDFTIGENEKPYLSENKEVHFNLSHCPRAAVCMMSRYPVGIDIQEIRDIQQKFLEKICSDTETNHIMEAKDPRMEFCKIWTQKEAISKYTGEGIFRDVKQISLDQAPMDVMAVTVQITPEIYMTACGNVEDANFTIRRVSIQDLLSLTE